MRHGHELDAIARPAVVEPGVVCDQLDEATAPLAARMPEMAGRAVDDTEEMEVLLSDGTVMNVGWMTDAGLDAAIVRGVSRYGARSTCPSG
jgi:hypothetical protein